VRIKLDENLPAGLVPLPAALGHEVDTVPAKGLGGQERVTRLLRAAAAAEPTCGTMGT
jgi:hypothetical protein